ncbi:MAG TPA: TerB family tellurite resistance protein [Gammaproteobacteria bacterium]|nr:TerB family tellurite resistance protein [Gammaproteobacteria bacterium]
MPIIIGMLGSIATILWILYRLAEMGITLGGLNPFLWRRRRAWRQKYEANPLFSLTEPLDVTALLAVATAKADGDMSAAERHALLAEFEKTFSLTPRKASELLTASVHLLGDGATLRDKLDELLAKCRERFSDAQRTSALELLERVAAASGRASPQQLELIARVRATLSPELAQKGTWA